MVIVAIIPFKSIEQELLMTGLNEAKDIVLISIGSEFIGCLLTSSCDPSFCSYRVVCKGPFII